MATTLERMQHAPATPLPLAEDLAAESARELGYLGAQEAVGRVHEVKRLYAALREVGVGVYTPESVARYKNAKRRAKATQVVRWQALALPLAGLAFWGLAKPGAAADSAAAAGLVGMILALALPAILLAPSAWTWQDRRIGDYSQPIPAPVLQTALAVTRSVPKVTLWVESFERERRIVADPFLVVRGQFGVELHIEVWNEPRFEGRRG